MTTADRINRAIIVLLLSISIFLFLECYVFPFDKSKGVIVTKTEQKISRLRVNVFRLETEKHTITVPPLVYNRTRVNDTIVIGRSFLTHAIQQLDVYGKGAAYSWRIGFVASGGLDYLIFLIIANAAFLFYFYQQLKKPQMRRDLTLFLSFVSVIFFVLYILFE